MDQAMQQYQLQQQVPGPAQATQHISNLQAPQPLMPQQQLAGIPVAGPAAAGLPRPGLPPGSLQLPMQPAVSLAPQTMPAFQLPMSAAAAAAVARPPGLLPGTLPLPAPRPALGLQGQQQPQQLPPQIPPAMLPLLGYPLPLLQGLQNMPLEELAKHSGIALPMLQAAPQLQLAARQIMLQRIMAFQIQAQQQQQQRPAMLHPQQAASLQAAQRVAAAPKARGGARQPKQPKQSKAAAQKAAAAAAAAAQPANSDGATAGQDLGGKLIWAKLGTYPWWPAKTLSESDPSYPPDADPPRPTSIPIRFFGTYEFSWIGSKRAIADWDEAYEEHVRACDQESFRAAVDEVEHYKRTGELPQVFYIRPAPEGRAKARGRRKPRPRSGGQIPGGTALPGAEDASGTPATHWAGSGSTRPRPLGRSGHSVAAEERAAVVRARKKRLLQEMGLAPPDDSPWANGRICPNPALLKLEQVFEEQWPKASRPQPDPAPVKHAVPPSTDQQPVQQQQQPSIGPAAAHASAMPGAVVGATGVLGAAPGAVAGQQQQGNLGPAAALAAALSGQQQQQHQQGSQLAAAAAPVAGAVPLAGYPVAVQQQQAHAAEQRGAAPGSLQGQPAHVPAPHFPGHFMQQLQQQQQVQQMQPHLSLAHLHNLTPQQQVAVMAGLVQQATGPQQQQHYQFIGPVSLRVCSAVPDNLSGLLEALDVPDIEHDLASYQEDMGATFSEDGVPTSYGNDEAALRALGSGVVVVDRSHCGRVRLTGEDRLAFLHGQSTADITSMEPGQGTDTVFVTAQARCLDLATCLVQGAGVLLLLSPGQKEAMLQRLDKYIFPGDKVKVTDVSHRTVQFSLLGPSAGALLGMLGVDAEALAKRGHGAHTLLGLGGRPLVVAVGGGLVPGKGFTLVADEACGGQLWKLLVDQGAVPMGEEAWEAARIVCGRPAPGSELTQDFNPLEAGLYYAISIEKGCYIGQETISKVHQRDAVKQQLWGLELEAKGPVGSTVSAGGKVLGKVTSYVELPSGTHHSLAYLRCKSEGAQTKLEGLAVQVEPAPAEAGNLPSGAPVRGLVVAVPALSRGFPAPEEREVQQQQQQSTAGSASSSSSSSSAQLQANTEAARRQREEEEAAAAREEKLRAMQERLAAWQAQQAQQQ
ncbi:hypothetical protein N2152v2_005126 [Parachlorella kessleri]